jgi:hypothetical protein
MTVETFSDYKETERSNIVYMAIGACTVSHVNKFIRVTIKSPRAAPIVQTNAFDVLLQANLSRNHVPRKFEPKEGKELQFPEKLFDEIAEQQIWLGLGVRCSEIEILANFTKALRDAIISCEAQKDMVLPETFDRYTSRRTISHNRRALGAGKWPSRKRAASHCASSPRASSPARRRRRRRKRGKIVCAPDTRQCDSDSLPKPPRLLPRPSRPSLTLIKGPYTFFSCATYFSPLSQLK